MQQDLGYETLGKQRDHDSSPTRAEVKRALRLLEDLGQPATKTRQDILTVEVVLGG